MSINKSNILIQQANHSLNSIQLKFLNKVLEMIDTDAKEFEQYYYINLNDFVENDLKYESNKNLHNVIKKLKEMRDKGFQIVSEKAKELDEQQEDLILSMLKDNLLPIEKIVHYSKAPLYRVLNFLKTLDLSKKHEDECKELEKNVVIPEGEITTIELYTGWFSTIETTSNSNVVRIELPKGMEKYYLGLKEKGNYSKVNAKLVYKLKSKYSIRIYELIYSHSHKNKKIKNKQTREYEDYIEVIIPYKKLKKILGVTHKYKDYRDFRRLVLVTAEKELKKKETDVQFSYGANGRGEGKDIVFKIYNAKEQKENQEAQTKEDIIKASDNFDQENYHDSEAYLKHIGMKEKEINKIISNNEEMKIRRNINYTINFGKNHKFQKNELAFFRYAIKEDIAMQDHQDKQDIKKHKESKKKKPFKPLPMPEETKLQPIDKQKNELKDNPFLYKEFLEFLYKFVEENPKNRRIPEILKTLTEGVESLDYIPDRLTTELMISKFFKFRGDNS